MTGGRVPGMLALTCDDAVRPPESLRAMLVNEDLGPAEYVNGVWLAAWGLGSSAPGPGEPMLLSSTNRTDSGPATILDIAAWLATGDLGSLGRMLPPFAALGLAPGGLRIAADQMGFRQLFKSRGDGWSAVSTSARLLSVLRGGGLDTEGLLLQSQLGWQLGQRTLFEGVSKLAPGEAIFLHREGSRSEMAPLAKPEPGTLPLNDAVDQATLLLRGILEQYVDDTPSAMLQLTGGQDSRILLSAIPPHRRRDLRAMTLDVPGSNDARIAGELAARYGMRHIVSSLDSLDTLSPAEWFTRVWNESIGNDCMNDPLARSVTGWAEESFEQGQRLSGLGGEIARGFYYTGLVRPKRVTRRRTEFLARWRMLANEPVEPAALAPAHRVRAIPLSLDLIHTELLSAGTEWYVATDELYHHRMQRWAGLGETAVTFRRTLTNPMLDHRFVDIARRLSPMAKQHSRFLARLQVSLDEELASVPLDNRPAPRFLASGGPVNRGHQLASGSRRLLRKVRQRVANTHRPPAGGAVVAAKLVQHLRQQAAALDPVRELDVFDQEWLDGLVDGHVDPAPSSLALLMNVLAATAPRT